MIKEGILERRVLRSKKYRKLDIFTFIKSKKCRKVDAYKYDDNWYFFVGCQKAITKEEFINRIYNEDGGLEENPHRQLYLDFLDNF